MTIKNIQTRPARICCNSEADAEFYESVVRERSPLTGEISPPRYSPIPVLLTGGKSSEDAVDPRSLSPRAWTLIAASLLLGIPALLMTLSRASNAVDSEKSAALTQITREKPPISRENPADNPHRRQPIVAPLPLLPAKDLDISAPSEVGTASVESSIIPTKDANAEFNLLAEAKKIEDASQREMLLRRALTAAPDNDEAMALLSLTLMHRPKTRKEAMSLAKRAAEINDGNATAWLAIGYIQRLNGKFDKAKKAYQKCAASSGPAETVTDCRKLI